VPDEVTELLLAHQRGDRQAFERLLPLIYEDLKRVAARQRRRARSGDTLNTTALVHDAYMHLVAATSSTWEGRAHFFAIAARAMRRVLVDYALMRKAQKRGGGGVAVTLDAVVLAVDSHAEELAALDEALRRLEAIDERHSRVVECRVFAGMSVEETAAALDISPATVKRDWTFARAFLLQSLSHAS
jgi:RNA polymerase sigma factor (TIGR02999 family)